MDIFFISLGIVLFGLMFLKGMTAKPKKENTVQGKTIVDEPLESNAEENKKVEVVVEQSEFDSMARPFEKLVDFYRSLIAQASFMDYCQGIVHTDQEINMSYVIYRLIGRDIGRCAERLGLPMTIDIDSRKGQIQYLCTYLFRSHYFDEEKVSYERYAEEVELSRRNGFDLTLYAIFFDSDSDSIKVSRSDGVGDFELCSILSKYDEELEEQYRVHLRTFVHRLMKLLRPVTYSMEKTYTELFGISWTEELPEEQEASDKIEFVIK